MHWGIVPGRAGRGKWRDGRREGEKGGTAENEGYRRIEREKKNRGKETHSC
jgi:hypothetical protein